MLKNGDQRTRLSLKAAATNLGVTVLSLVVALLLAEGMLRLYFALSPTSATPAAPADAQIGARYAQSFAIGTDLDPRIYQRTPSSPRDDGPDPEDMTRFKAYVSAGKFGPQSYYVWNEEYAKSVACDAENQHFKNVPVDIRVFSAIDGEAHPIYRFLPDRTLPGGLKTNSYGFRGADFPLEKRSGVIRIAFIGSSQTVGNGGFPASFPEYFGFWLNEWLEGKGSSLRVEIINAGREGISTTDVRAILRQEVLPLDPDYVIFFDGANQLGGSDALVHAQGPIQREKLEYAISARRLFPQWLASHSKVASLINDAYDLYAPRRKKKKRPAYVFAFPDNVDENAPNITRDDLPLGMTAYIRDVQGMAQDARAAGAHFYMSTPFWLDGSELTDRNNPHIAFIARYLRSVFWPLNPSEIRRLIEFQTRALREVARNGNIPLLDIAADFPHDPNLFSDAYHVNEVGEPLLAWIALRRFLPSFTADVGAGAAHQEVKPGFLPPRRVSLNYSVFHPHCLSSEDVIPHAPADQVAKAKPLKLERMVAMGDTIVEKTEFTLTGHTVSAVPWHYIATFDLNAACLAGGGWVVVDIIAKGDDIGVGIENKAGNDFLTRQFVKPRRESERVSLRVAAFDQ
ncbi:MAG: SGNH/GDSL hydrolase family protein, partial [Hyphomicrobiales bacterium]|nr:SGNH/GDSL hydrolase family protein [Hyphomicrobiales bacterium]